VLCASAAAVVSTVGWGFSRKKTQKWGPGAPRAVCPAPLVPFRGGRCVRLGKAEAAWCGVAAVRGSHAAERERGDWQEELAGLAATWPPWLSAGAARRTKRFRHHQAASNVGPGVCPTHRASLSLFARCGPLFSGHVRKQGLRVKGFAAARRSKRRTLTLVWLC